jgi:hypothetical protein
MYRQKQSPQYENFRQSWMQGYKNALRVKRQLQGQGWIVERGALTQNQAQMTIKDLEKSGYETQTSPVAEWNGEQIHLIAYKLKPGAAPPQLKTKPKPKKATTKDPTEEFLKIFWKGYKEKDEPDSGVLMDPARVAAVVPKGASPQQNANLVKLMKEGVQQAEKVEPLDYSTLVKVEKIGKTQNQPQKYVSFGSPNSCYSIDLIKKGMRVLGTKTEAEAYYCADKLLVVRHKETGHSIVIAPSFEDSSNPLVVSISMVQAM